MKDIEVVMGEGATVIEAIDEFFDGIDRTDNALLLGVYMSQVVLIMAKIEQRSESSSERLRAIAANDLR